MVLTSTNVQVILREACFQLGLAPISEIVDLSPGVSSNYVYRLQLADGTDTIAKWTCFGRYEHFLEDHQIIAEMIQKLPQVHQGFLSPPLSVEGKLAIHRSSRFDMDSWVAFYDPIEHALTLPKVLPRSLITKMGEQLALFHRSCAQIGADVSPSSKTTRSDVLELVQATQQSTDIDPGLSALILQQCDAFLSFNSRVEEADLSIMPIMVDWNIGNFSVDKDGNFFSRWDYDWFRVSTRMLDFYFFARVVSAAGDRSSFTYEITVMQEERFLHFLRAYHEVFPLTPGEIRLLPELYRFFLLNYVIKFGQTFFRDYFAERLQKDVLQTHFATIDDFDEERLLKEIC
ncbi:MAG: hypothetical protein KTR24_02795 [Saprospiraceae bacterium]|nr:hypothetical protein [Saprospiraceae bacterium]